VNDLYPRLYLDQTERLRDDYFVGIIGAAAILNVHSHIHTATAPQATPASPTPEWNVPSWKQL